MKLLTTKVYRVTNCSDALRAYGIARQAADLYSKQRYSAPGEDQSDRWRSVMLDTHTTLFQFHQSDIVIVERMSEQECIEALSLDEQVGDQEADLDQLLASQETFYKPLWAAHWLVLAEDERASCSEAARYWLKDTARPEDADAIRAGAMDVSMTWLRYLAIDNDGLDARRREMRIAQFYYAELDQMNADLLGLISKLNTRKTSTLAEMSSFESVYEMKKIQLQEDLRVIPRSMKNSIETILSHWEFDRLEQSVSNLQRLYANMVEKKLERRAGISRLVTEAILLMIGLLAFFDLVISWSLLGRELVANPILLMDELELPLTARLVANMPMDALMFSVSSIVCLLLVVYVLFRRAFR